MIVWAIFKIIGIVLGCVLGFAILLLLMVFFCPLAYSGTAEKEDTELTGEGTVKWLLGFVTAKISYQNKKTDAVVQICGIRIWEKGKEKKQSALSQGKKAAEKSVKKNKTEKKEQTKEKEKKAKKQNPEKKKNFLKKVQTILQKLKQGREWAEDEKIRLALRHLLNQILKLVLHILPNRMKGTICFGLEAPDQTAVLYGVTANIADVFWPDLLLLPELEEKKFEFQLAFRGRILIGYLVVWLLKCVLNKYVLYSIRTIKKTNSEK